MKPIHKNTYLFLQPMEVVWKLKPPTEPKKKTITQPQTSATATPSPHRKWSKEEVGDSMLPFGPDDDDEDSTLRQRVGFVSVQ